MNIVFSILHYKEYEITSNCVNSILELNLPKNLNLKIVIVENPIENNISGKILNLKYKDNKNIIFLKNSRNGGFAEGNNLGYSYAKRNLNPDIFIALNNDILIEDKFFIEKMLNVKEKCDIIAPKILNLESTNQNPFRKEKLSKISVLFEFFKICILEKIYLNKILGKKYLLCKNKKVKKEGKQFLEKLNYEFNIVPHGAFIIYKKSYISKEEFAFVPGTFLYCEEDLLAWYIKQKKYISLYAPVLEVKHLEHVTTSSMENDLINNYRKIFSLKKQSIKILLKKEFKIIFD